jgi:predicted aspartyl protease
VYSRITEGVAVGFTYVKIRVYNFDLSKWKDVEVLVDSGALFTSIPRSILEELGLKPIAKRKLRVFSGEVIERDVGGAIIEYEGKRAVVPVVFGEPEDVSVLGVTALEALGYKLDPVTKKLKPVELLMI